MHNPLLFLYCIITGHNKREFLLQHNQYRSTFYLLIRYKQIPNLFSLCSKFGSICRDNPVEVSCRSHGTNPRIVERSSATLCTQHFGHSHAWRTSLPHPCLVNGLQSHQHLVQKACKEKLRQA